MKTFTTYAEKKAKQFLNLLQGYTKGIRITAILILLLMGVSNAWADTYYYSGQGNGTNWSKKSMTVSADGFYEYYLVSSTTTHQFKIGTSSNQYAYNKDYVSKNFNGTNIANIGDYGGDNCYCWQGSKHYILVYKPNTTINTSSKPKICAATYLPDNRECTVYFVNRDSWNSVNAYGWYYQNNTDGSNNGWPGKAMTNTGKTYNGKQIWSYTYPQTYDKAIFNNGSSQTSDLTLGTTNKGKMYDYPNEQWIAYTYDVKVTFNANGHGTAPTAKTVLKGGKVSAPTAPTATGYTFDGWYKEAGCTNAFDFNTAINADITLYAKWTANTYTVTLNPQSGTGGTTSVTATYGSAMPAITQPTRTGYTFNGYYDATSGGTQYYKADGSSARAWNKAAATTLYAQWTPAKYTINYKDQNNANFSGSHASGHPTTHTYGTATSLKEATKIGYTFDGWFTTSACTGTAVTSLGATDYTSNITLYAKWTEVPPTTVYLKPINDWKNDDARFAVYMWKDDVNEWRGMEDLGCNGDIYTVDIPRGYTGIKFVRLKPVSHAEFDSWNGGYNWNNRWNETVNLTIPTGDKNLYDMTETKASTKLYFTPHENWKQADARFAAYFFGNGAKWVDLTHHNDGIYACDKPSGYTKVIFGRMNPATKDNNFNDDVKWNQTSDIPLPTNGQNHYILTGGEWDGVTGEWHTAWDDRQWTTYTAPSYKLTIQSTANGTVAVSKVGGGALDNNETIKLGDEITITFTPNDGYELSNYFIEYATATDKADTYTVCGPTEITAEFDLIAPSRTVYLRPNEDWLRDNPVMAARVRKSSGGTDKWYVMHTTSEDYTGAYSCNIPNDYDKIIFVRLNPKGSEAANYGLNWDNAWNQTKELTILDKDNDDTNDKKLRFAIGDKIVGGTDNDRYDGKWEENTPIWGLTANFNDWTAEKAVFKGYPGHLDVMPPFGTSHEFKLYNFVYENNKYHGNAGTMKRANSGQWWTMDASEQANCKMMLDVKGDYIYQMRFLTVGAELRKQISVTYPEADKRYALLYKDKNVSRISYDIPAVNGEQNDTISFFVDKDANPTIKLLVNTNETGEAIEVSVSESGVYNFILQQNGGEVTVSGTNPEPYEGNYYIRTDAAGGGWGGYKQNGNKMTYNSYADSTQNFDHYYCKWICNHSDAEHKDFRAYTNVKFCVANDYSHKLSDELDGDEIIEKAEVPTGCLPEDANVRFGWDSKTNELSRAYIAGATTATKETFLHIIDAEDLKNSEGISVPGINFTDLQNWIYQVDVKATNATKIKLVADYAEKRQYFKGNEETKINLLSSTAQKTYDIRLIYNFKCNHLVVAMILNGDKEVTEDDVLGADMMVIRKDQDQAEQLTFNPNAKKLSEVGTVYSVMTFTKTHIQNNELAERVRSLYWVSFPFDVKVSDVFGFGEYAEHWILQYYDGAERAEKGLFSDSGTYWKYIFDTDTELKAGQGYVLVLDLNKIEFLHGAEEVSLYFPSTNPLTTISGVLPTPDTVPEHWCNIEREWKEGETTYHHKYTDSHWNLIGVPGFADINFDLNVTKYHFMQDDASFYYNFNLAESTYAVEASQVTEFQAMYAYMVQFAGTIDWTSSTVVGATPTEPKLAARRNSDSQPEKITLRLELAQADKKVDQTFVQLQQEGATANFDLSLDLTKIMNSGFSNIYTLTDSLKIQVAGNALPMEETVVPVGVNIATAGEYTFRMPDGTEGMVVELIDYETNTRTNLLLSDYTVNLPAGSNETRFALSIKPEKVATSIETTTTSSNPEVRKFIIDGKLYLQKDGMLYDAQGHSVR